MFNRNCERQTMSDMYIPNYIDDPDKSLKISKKNNIDNFKYIALINDEEIEEDYFNIGDITETNVIQNIKKSNKLTIYILGHRLFL